MRKLTQGIYPGVACGIIILVLTSLPGSCFKIHEPAIPYLDKVVHFLMFAAFAAASLWGFRDKINGFDKTRLLKTALLMTTIGAAYGCLTEAIQHLLIDGRTGSIGDIAADILGTVTGTASYMSLKKKRDFFSKKEAG